MTLKLMQGFDTANDYVDLYAQGLIPGDQPAFPQMPPSMTGQPGNGLRFSSYTNNNGSGVIGTSGAYDVGVYNTGVTVNQAWNNGGITMGFNGTPLNNTTGSLALPTGTVYPGDGPRCLVWDDVHNVWWATLQNSSANIAPAIGYSSDLKTWTWCATQPTTNTSQNSTLQYMGGGIVMYSPNLNGTSQNRIFYYSSNLGATWSMQTIVATAGTSNCLFLGAATGNSTYPHLIVSNTTVTDTSCGVYIGTLGGAFTKVAAFPASISVGSTMGAIVFTSNLVTIFSASSIVSSPISTMNNTAAGTAGTSWTNVAGVLGVQSAGFHAASNKWIVANASGIFSLVNPGTSAAPLAPTSNTTTAILSQANIVWPQMWALSNNTLVAPFYTTSTNPGYGGGVSVINASGAHEYHYNAAASMPPAFANTYPTNVIASQGYGSSCVVNGRLYMSTLWINGQYNMMRCQSYIVSSVDGYTDVQFEYASQGQGVSGTGYSFFGTAGTYCGTGLCTSSTAPVAGTPWTVGARSAWINPVSFTSNQFQAWTSPGTTNTGSVTYTATTYTPGKTTFVEITLIPNSSAVNTFDIQYSLDSNIIGTITAVPFGTGTTDTTSLFLCSFGRAQHFIQTDDLYVTLNDGIGISGPFGGVNIVPLKPGSDVSKAWINSGTTSNAAALNKRGPGADANYVSSQVQGDTDQYTAANTLTPSTRVRTVKLLSYHSASGGAATVNVGIKDANGVQMVGDTVIPNLGSAYVSGQFDTDSQGNAWTLAELQAANFVLVNDTPGS